MLNAGKFSILYREYTNQKGANYEKFIDLLQRWPAVVLPCQPGHDCRFHYQPEIWQLLFLALCLEDTISDLHVEEAEHILAASICQIDQAAEKQSFYLPKIFVRVREPAQIPRLLKAAWQKPGTAYWFYYP